jgi:hypothetical protein
VQDLLTNVGPRDNTPAQDGVITISAFGTDERTVPAGRTVLETLRQAGMMPATYEDVHLNGKRVADLDNTTLRTGDRLYLSPHPQGG